MDEATAIAIASEWWSSLPYLERAALAAQFGLEGYPVQALLASGALVSLYQMGKRFPRGQGQHDYLRQKVAATLGATTLTLAPLEAPVTEPAQTPVLDKRLRTTPPTVSRARIGTRPVTLVTAAPVQLPVVSHGLLYSEIVPIFGRSRRFRRYRRRY